MMWIIICSRIVEWRDASRESSAYQPLRDRKAKKYISLVNDGYGAFTATGRTFKLFLLSTKSANDLIMLRPWQMRILSISLAVIQVIYRTMKDSLVWQAAQKHGRAARLCRLFCWCNDISRKCQFSAMGIRSTAAFGILPIASLMPHLMPSLYLENHLLPLSSPINRR
jgi:hypothetical protein